MFIRSDKTRSGKVFIRFGKVIIRSGKVFASKITAVQLHKILAQEGHPISLRTILICRTELGWMFRGSAYCQLIWNVNKLKILKWAVEHQNDDYSDVICTDGASIQLQKPSPVLLSEA